MTIAHSEDAMKKIVELVPAGSTLFDVGAGEKQVAANFFRSHGLEVDTNDFMEGATYVGNYMEMQIDKQYDVVWSAHCLEHQLNVNLFLAKLKSNTKEGGLICITVPPRKDQIVSGHVSLWNAGLLLYNLILAGLDCSAARCKTYGYNVSVIVPKRSITLPADLTYNAGDLERLKNYFPVGLQMTGKGRSFNGNIESLNWDSAV